MVDGQFGEQGRAVTIAAVQPATPQGANSRGATAQAAAPPRNAPAPLSLPTHTAEREVSAPAEFHETECTAPLFTPRMPRPPVLRRRSATRTCRRNDVRAAGASLNIHPPAQWRGAIRVERHRWA